MKLNIKALLISLAIPLGVGGISALLTMGNMDLFNTLEKPLLTPPSIVFPIVWTILFTLMGVSLYLVRSNGKENMRAYFLFATQLFFNFSWSIIFFNLEWYGVAFVWLLSLLALVIACAVEFFKINRVAGLLFIPYIVWVAFAGYLNLAIAAMN